MDKNTLLRWVIIAVGTLVFIKWGLPLIQGKSDQTRQPVPAEVYADAPGFVGDSIDPPPPGTSGPNHPAEGELCTIKGNRFNAVLSSRGAGITHYFLTDTQYAGSEAADLSTTPDLERWRSLRTLFRTEGANDQVKYDRFEWKLAKEGDASGQSCRFTYADDTVKIDKVVTAGKGAFELDVDTTITNLSDAPKRHRFSIQDFAYRRNEEVKGKLGRVSPFMTDLECANGKDTVRKSKDDFKEGWWSQSADRYAAVDNYFFAQALFPSTPATCMLLAEEWYSEGQAKNDDKAGHVYHARLDYPVAELAPNGSKTYSVTSFTGPKEREVLANAAGGQKGAGSLINLGFFSPVAKLIVMALVFFHDKATFGSWGLAVIVLTFALRLLLFPLTWKQIKTTLAMRRLKPELDALNAKFPDDAQAKNMAMMELYRKKGVNPFGGCLPMLVQMPVWWAMYQTLQTAVEMYHTKFLWFTDLSAPDKYYVLPIVLGFFMIIQQRIVPQQGMDPVQQKMMTYLLPLVFTVMMLFLPAALGVYMLTNSVLGISQQLAIEQFAPRGDDGKKSGGIEVREANSTSGGNKRPPSLRKGNARV